VQDNDTTRQELARFDQFLDDHPNIAEQVRKDPSLVNNPDYERNNPELHAFLESHPNIREEIKENPNAFMRQEDRFDRHEGDRDGDHDGRGRGDNDTTRGELARFDQFLDGHPEIAQELRRDPSLVDNPEYEKNHPALQAYLADHPQIREEIKENPNAFMRLESRYDRREDARDDNRYDRRDGDRDGDRDSRGNGGRGDNDTTRGELARFDQFLDSHREIAEQLRKDPSLVNNQKFESTHPALHTYLQDHPQIREEIKENPNAFMRQEDRYDHQENGHTNYVDRDSHEQAARFGKFLNSHSNVANELSRDPSVVKNQEFMENHPELRDYLKENPDVQKELMANPPTFVKSATEFSADKGKPGQTPTQSQSPSSTAEPKPKQ
jgi:dsDNA-binding SOS-regulon protein